LNLPKAPKPLLQQLQERNCFAAADKSLSAGFKQPSLYLTTNGAGFVTREPLVATRKCLSYKRITCAMSLQWEMRKAWSKKLESGKHTVQILGPGNHKI
jgi:hypothetical protein